jgi:hypothetical protein
MGQRNRAWLVGACIVGLLVFGAALPSAALDLDTARAQGLVGEQSDGYVGAVSPSASGDVKALVAEVNGKRRAAYADIAKKNGTAPDAVAALSGQKLIERAPAGQWIGDKGRWTQKN